jgi:hypothetical protein
MYENEKMRPAETPPVMGRESIKETDGGDELILYELLYMTQCTPSTII